MNAYMNKIYRLENYFENEIFVFKKSFLPKTRWALNLGLNLSNSMLGPPFGRTHLSHLVIVVWLL